MIATLAEFKIVLGMAETDDSQDKLLNLYLNAVDVLFNTFCDCEFTSTTYTHEMINGDGGKRIWLKHKPVTAITQISAERIPAIRIKNTTSGASRATIDVDVSAQTLVHTLVVGTTTTTASIDLTDAATDTLLELITAINALGNGWSSEIDDTDLNGLPSIELLEVQGLNCAPPRRGGDATFKDLDISGNPLDGEFRIEIASTGMIYKTGGWPRGINNIIVSYTAGFTTGASGTVPADLKMAVLAGAQALFVRGEEDGFGASSFNQGELQVKYGDWLPDFTLQMLEAYSQNTFG